MRNSRPNFGRDSAREGFVADFLDQHLYPVYFQSHQRVSDRSEQLSGIDIRLEHEDIVGDLLVDEKAATSWAHREIGTFAFELSFLLNEEEYGGWFLDIEGRSKTTHWLCVWPRTTGGKISSSEDIVSAEVILLDARKLRHWVRRMGQLEQKGLQEIVNQIRNDVSLGELEWAGLRVLISRSLPEQPVNLLLPKDVLRSLSGDLHWDLWADYSMSEV